MFFSIISVASQASMALLSSPHSKDLHYFFEVLLLLVPLGHCPSCLCEARVSVAPWVQNNPSHSLPPSSLSCSFFLCLGIDPPWFYQWEDGMHNDIREWHHTSSPAAECEGCRLSAWSALSSLGWHKPGWGGERGGGELQLRKEREAGDLLPLTSL